MSHLFKKNVRKQENLQEERSTIRSISKMPEQRGEGQLLSMNLMMQR